MAEVKKIWQVAERDADDFVDAYTVADDYLLDNRLLPFDIEASRAHAEMLEKMGILTGEELAELTRALDAILPERDKGNFEIKVEHEDCHTAIEEFLTERCGELGKKIHTGRSRNDQILVAMRLFMKGELAGLRSAMREAISSFAEVSSKYRDLDMPGYTHYQRAMPTSCGVWLGSFADALGDAMPFVDALGTMLDQNPLGSASGFGIRNFPVDRDLTAELLSFARVQENPIYAAFSRGYFENVFLQTFSQPALCLLRFASDLLLFSTAEFSFVRIAEKFSTGSSIMPQKRNPDTVEVLRGKLCAYLSLQNQVQGLVSGLPSGYHRAFSLLKRPFFEALDVISDSLKIAAMLASSIAFNESALKRAMTEELFVTERVYDYVKRGVPFREAYGMVKREFMASLDKSGASK